MICHNKMKQYHQSLEHVSIADSISGLNTTRSNTHMHRRIYIFTSIYRNSIQGTLDWHNFFIQNNHITHHTSHTTAWINNMASVILKAVLGHLKRALAHSCHIQYDDRHVWYTPGELWQIGRSSHVRLTK